MTTTRRRTATWALALASAAAIVVANANGLSVSDDGIGYLAISNRLLAGKGLGYFLEPRLTTWPPLWPVLIAGVAKVTPLGAAGAAVVLNVLVAAVTVLLAAALLGRVVRDERLVLVGTAVAAVGSSTVLLGHILGTDVAFAAAVLGVVLALLRWGDEPTFPNLLLPVVVVWCAFGLRYAGLALVPAGMIWIAVGRSRPHRLLTALGFGVASSVVPVAWMLRNHSVDGTLLGARYPSARGVVGNALDTLASLGTLLLPGVMTGASGRCGRGWGCCASASWPSWAGASSGAVPRCARGPAGSTWPPGRSGSWRSGWSSTSPTSSTHGRPRPSTGSTSGSSSPSTCRSSSRRSRCAIASIRSRQSPDAPPLASTRRWASAATGVVALWASVTLVVGVVMVPYFASGPDLFDGNYNRAAFEDVRSSPVLDEAVSNCRVESNLPSALYRSGAHAEWSPRLGPLHSSATFDDLDDLPEEVGAKRTCLVWIDLDPRFDNVATLDQIRSEVDLDELARDGDVTVFVMRPKAG